MPTDDSTIPLRRCTRCEQEFPRSLDYFWYSPSSNKWNSRCIPCARELAREKMRKWRTENPDEAREKAKLEQREFRKRNKERVNANDRIRGKKRYAANVEKERERGRLKYQRLMATNPEQHRSKSRRSNHTRRARKRGNTSGEHFTKQDIESLFNSQKGLCWWCGKKLKKYEIDHRIPLARGGSNSANNICLTCSHCNRTKSDKMPHEWSDRLL